MPVPLSGSVFPLAACPPNPGGKAACASEAPATPFGALLAGVQESGAAPSPETPVAGTPGAVSSLPLPPLFAAFLPLSPEGIVPSEAEADASGALFEGEDPSTSEDEAPSDPVPTADLPLAQAGVQEAPTSVPVANLWAPPPTNLPEPSSETGAPELLREPLQGVTPSTEEGEPASPAEAEPRGMSPLPAPALPLGQEASSRELSPVRGEEVPSPKERPEGSANPSFAAQLPVSTDQGVETENRDPGLLPPPPMVLRGRVQEMKPGEVVSPGSPAPLPEAEAALLARKPGGERPRGEVAPLPEETDPTGPRPSGEKLVEGAEGVLAEASLTSDEKPRGEVRENRPAAKGLLETPAPEFRQSRGGEGDSSLREGAGEFPEASPVASTPSVTPGGGTSGFQRVLEASPVVSPEPLVLSYQGDEAFREALTHVLRVVSQKDGVRAHLVVDPPALGRVDVSLQVTAAGIEATLKVDNEALRQMVQTQMEQLKASLQAQGLQVTGLAVDLRSRDEQRPGQQEQTAGKIRRASGVSGEGAEDEEDVLEARLDLRQGLLQWVA